MKLGLLKCDPSPARGGRCTTGGAAGWGVRDWWIQGCWCLWGCSGWRWGLFCHQAPSKPSPATNNALHRSVLQWVASCCNRKGRRCAEFVPLPLFFYENVVSYSEKEVLAENASVHLQVPPPGVLGCRRVLASHCTQQTDFPARGCRVAIMGEVTLFLKEKRCRDVSDCTHIGCWAQKYAAARL